MKFLLYFCWKMKFTTIYKAGLAVCVALVLFSCGSKNATTITVPATLSAEGPFFEGANSLMAPLSLDLSELVKEEGFESAAAVQLIDVKLTIDDENVTDLGLFKNATLQFVGKTNPMTTVAILNPLTFTENTATLVTSQEADIKPFFEEDEFTALLDLDFSNDEYWEGLAVKVNMSFNVEY